MMADNRKKRIAEAADAPDHMIHFNGERFLGPY
jgi:hypothetical protein